MSTATDQRIDIVIIGGGINGTGIAADAAGRGLSVLLCEQGDLACATSSASSKLIHGGLRYLEHYEFRLVREALAEREVLLRNAPHLVQPLRFTLPHRPWLRPGWMIRSGLFLYDHLSTRSTLPGTSKVRFGVESPLKPEMKKGFQYSDCWVDDARLVLTNALMAQQRGARIMTQTKCVSAQRDASGNHWNIELEGRDGLRQTVTAKAVVNAAGPWVAKVTQSAAREKPRRGVRLIKGSHLIVEKFHDFPGAFILQNTDRRIVFVLPYQDNYHLIGTTDKEYKGDPAAVRIDDDEVDYLIDVVNAHFRRDLSRNDVVSTYAGVRPLCDDESSDPSAVTRDYTLEVESATHGLPLLSIYGGKLTTYRKLAEAALQKLRPWFPAMREGWTSKALMPGAKAGLTTLEHIVRYLLQQHPWLPLETAQRFARSYGTLAEFFLAGAHELADLGTDFGSGLSQREVDYLVEREWATCSEDILWRRTKLGLTFTEQQVAILETYLGNRDITAKAS